MVQVSTKKVQIQSQCFGLFVNIYELIINKKTDRFKLYKKRYRYGPVAFYKKSYIRLYPPQSIYPTHASQKKFFTQLTY